MNQQEADFRRLTRNGGGLKVPRSLGCPLGDKFLEPWACGSGTRLNFVPVVHRFAKVPMGGTPLHLRHQPRLRSFSSSLTGIRNVSPHGALLSLKRCFCTTDRRRAGPTAVIAWLLRREVPSEGRQRSYSLTKIMDSAESIVCEIFLRKYGRESICPRCPTRKAGMNTIIPLIVKPWKGNGKMFLSTLFLLGTPGAGNVLIVRQPLFLSFKGGLQSSSAIFPLPQIPRLSPLHLTSVSLLPHHWRWRMRCG